MRDIHSDLSNKFVTIGKVYNKKEAENVIKKYTLNK